ncbi:MAG TPA: oxygenase MpaB family protein, partial [Solirubrobacteraceae bacterium]
MHDDGYFPRGKSMLRRVHGERWVGLLYGQRALCIGALAPLNYVGTSEHSYAKLTPFKRLAHTGHAFETIYFGTRAEADHVLAYVGKLHDRVVGELPEDAGPTPKGTPYSAMDPELMLWTVAVIADSAQRFYELLVKRLDASEREALWQDYIRFAELFGMPREAAPPSYEAFRAYWRAKLASSELFLTEEARYIGYATAFEIPMPRSQQLGKRVHDAIMLGSLPERVRELYGLPYTPRQRLAFTAAVQTVRASRRVTPKSIARGRNTRSFDGVAREERLRIERGHPTPQV